MDEEKLSPQEERRLLEMFEQSSLNDYPNPEREGCPETAFVRKLGFWPQIRPDPPSGPHTRRTLLPLFPGVPRVPQTSRPPQDIEARRGPSRHVLLAIGLAVFFDGGGWGIFPILTIAEPILRRTST